MQDLPTTTTPPYTHPLFAKWCKVGCVNDSTLTSSPFRSLIMPSWCCSHCCSKSQHFHYNFLFSGVFTVVIKIQSRLKLGIPGLLPGVISFCCIWKRKPFICFYITREQQKEAKAGFGEHFSILYCLLFLSFTVSAIDVKGVQYTIINNTWKTIRLWRSQGLQSELVI